MSSVEEQWLEAIDPEVLRRRREKIVLILGAVVLFCACGLFARYLYQTPAAPEEELLRAAQSVVRARVDWHGKLYFNSPAEAQVVSVGGERYEVRGWVRVLGGAGDSTSYLFTVILDHDVNRGAYTLVDADVIQQY